MELTLRLVVVNTVLPLGVCLSASLLVPDGSLAGQGAGFLDSWGLSLQRELGRRLVDWASWGLVLIPIPGQFNQLVLVCTLTACRTC
jgi:hypothetical protein